MKFRDTKAIYLQIADYICEQVLLKNWNEGDRMPSVREMAITVEVNPNTVIRTYAFLEEQGIILMQRGVGYFVKTDAYKKAIELKKQEFMELDLPNFFKMLDLLNLNFDEIKQHYQKRNAKGH